MLVSWNWLKDYVACDTGPDEVTHRLAMAGLNHESTRAVADDLAIDLEVTSNRPDCLGHIGIAREMAVLWDRALKIPDPQPPGLGSSVHDRTQVRVECPELCPRYTARVIRGATIRPSPSWLTRRLATIGVSAINNVVDVTNYVLMECGQPLHAFDLARLTGREIIVREAAANEPFIAIDHRNYVLERGMCVIADGRRAVALGGVMGGAESEVSSSTRELLVEAAEFAPRSIRATARKLNLHSPSSFRFERGVDSAGVEWASRRCCELILELAGGELADGVIDVGATAGPRLPIVLRLSQLKRILGITIDTQTVQRILAALGCEPVGASHEQVESIPPTWRRDLTREIDLVEEVARIHGYDAIPEDVGVPMASSSRRDDDRILSRIRQVLTSSGFDEALTTSVVPSAWSLAFSPWTDAAPLTCNIPMLKGAAELRRSLLPSLLEARRINESLANPHIELFETARIYLPRGTQLPDEQETLSVTSGGDFFRLKGLIESIVETLNPAAAIAVDDFRHPLLDPEKSAELRIGSERLGFLGELSTQGQKEFGLRGPAAIAELRLATLNGIALLVPQHRDQSPYPAIARDLNLIVDESVRWSALAATVRQAVGALLEHLEYQDIYRDPEKDGVGKKRILFSLTLRSGERTLTNEEADRVRDTVVGHCRQAHGAVLLG